MREIVLLKSRLDKQGGAEKYTWRLSDAFLKLNCSVRLLTSGSLSAETQNPNLTIDSLTAKKWLSVSNVRAFDQFCLSHLSKLSKDVPIFGLDRNSFQTHIRASNGVHAAYLNHRKLFDSRLKSLSFNLNPLHRTLLAIEKASFTHPDLQVLIVNSHLVKQEILAHYSVDPKKIHVVHNGVEWSNWQESFDEWQQHKDPNHFHFLFLGSNFERKGLRPLLHALKHLPRDTFHLSIVGKDKGV